MNAALQIAAATACAVLLLACERPAERAARSATGTGAAKARVAAPLPKPPVAKYQRDVYARLADCVADWGFAGKCTPVAADASSHAGRFLGPIYSNALRSEAQVAARREAVEQGYLGQLDETPSDKSAAHIEIRS